MGMTRREIRYGAAAVAAIMAAIYFLIGLGVLNVGGTDVDRAFLWVFGALAGGAFLLGAILLPYIDRLGYRGWIGCEYVPAGDTVQGLAWAKRYL